MRIAFASADCLCKQCELKSDHFIGKLFQEIHFHS
jgi:hypothetical protein